jgi:signal transduction histidine kinase
MTTFDYVAAALYLIPGLVWAIISRRLWSLRPTARSRTRTLLVAPVATSVITLLIFLLLVTRCLLPPDVRENPPPPLLILGVLAGLAALALGRHMFRLMPIPERPPGLAWLTVNYGCALIGGGLFTLASILRPTSPAVQAASEVAVTVSYAVLVVLCLWEVVRFARPGRWGPSHAGELLRSDLVIGGVGAAATVILFAVAVGMGRVDVATVLFDVGIMLAIALPIVLSILPVVIVEFLVTATLLTGIAIISAGYLLTAGAVDPRWHPLLAVTAVLTLGAFLTPGQRRLRAWLHRIVLRRDLEQQAQLRAFLHTVSPQLGVEECCRRAVAELVRVRQLRGAAILLRSGEPIVQGVFNLEPLLRVWPRGADADTLPDRPFGTAELRSLPVALRDAIVAAGVSLGAAPIVSPTRRWGTLFLNTGLLGGMYRQEEMEAFEAFVAQLALLLDSADLLARALAVERSLAHAEKLAAIGETAARIAHEIRNPVAAARSLAQMLAREPLPSAQAQSASLILEELDRVERRVASLLRFSRREEYRFEAVDLGELVRATLDSLRPRLQAAEIELATDVAAGVMARGDRERVRQVLVNLIENAIDALGSGANGRRLTVGVGASEGRASVRVTDTGPGVPPEALSKLFEPFFSLKEKGTGLGLAIAKRTVEAHGGTIAARPEATGGMTFELQLPLADGAADKEKNVTAIE